MLLLKVGNELAHDGFCLLVALGFSLVLQNKIHGIALFAGFEVHAFVDIEKFHFLEEFLFGGLSNFLNGSKFH